MDSIARRKKTKSLSIGGVRIGGDAPIVVQSMTTTDTRAVGATVAQIRELEEAGCEIVRVAVPDEKAALAIRDIKRQIQVPLIADIHFSHELALLAMQNGADAIRINPGNIPVDGIRLIVKEARSAGKVIRIGINAGSLDKEVAGRHGHPTAEALVESALKSIRLLEEMDFDAIKLSLKSSDVGTTIEAYRLIAARTDYPLHLGVTEAGTLLQAAIKSAIGIGSLLHDGIGDTIRVSVTGPPVQEMTVAYGILRALNIRCLGPDIISCPTCGRCEIDLIALAGQVEKALKGMKAPLKIALMGCVVNGPGEAAEADIGIAGGRGVGILFKKGKIVRKIREEEFIPVLLAEIANMTAPAACGAGSDPTRPAAGEEVQ
ncbi:MAG: flavodoxin-dependent (E)-4-hydroxy-3-methylbut-2-enyl-diphosphate synthase [Deltaproteobacteria bacterium]|nr:flavodoxin-dependent (E)-4-hydroxy-3-methylbut-2-enyl-diphosphate synthase [Deltaproteobacteria bacterium]